MPRHVKAKAKEQRPQGYVCVERVAVESAQLIEIGPDHHYWNGDCGTLEHRNGSIVKLVPPPGTPASSVQAIERSFYEGGALSVKVMPVQEEEQIVVEGETFDFKDYSDDRPLRQVVMERAARTTNAYDQGALETLLTKAMDHAETAT